MFFSSLGIGMKKWNVKRTWIPGKFVCVQNEAGERLRVLPREPTGHSKLPTTQEMTLHMDITRWSIQESDDYILCSWRLKSSIQLTKSRPGADCGSDHELLIPKFRLKLKKVGKTTRPFRYDQIKSLMIIQWK